MTLAELRDKFRVEQRVLILAALAEARGNIATAARSLDANRTYIYRLMREHEIPIKTGRA